MKWIDTTIEYRSEEGDKIKVVLKVVRPGITLNDRGEGPIGHYGIFSTMVYVNNKLEKKYFGRGEQLDSRHISYIRPKLEELAEAKAGVDEVIATIDTLATNIAELDEIKSDEPERFFTL